MTFEEFKRAVDKGTLAKAVKGETLKDKCIKCCWANKMKDGDGNITILCFWNKCRKEELKKNV